MSLARRLAWWLAATAVVAGGGALRLVDLDARPMHTDEAVHAVKFGRLLETGRYEYDPHEYHGPTLNYLTLPSAKLAGASSLADLEEWHLRVVPALAGIVVTLVPLVLLRDALGRPGALAAAGSAAVSTSMVFYSRYYIQEMLLVCFTALLLGGGWRFVRAMRPGLVTRPARLGRRAWAIGMGWLGLAAASAGAMHATKETAAIALAALAVAVGAGAMLSKGPYAWHRLRGRRAAGLTAAGLVAALVAGAVSETFYSSLLTRFEGVIDSVGTYATYLSRASGRGEAGWHGHPWHFYLRRLTWFRAPGGALWTEAALVALASLGAAASIRGGWLARRRVTVARVLAIYTLAMVAIYSLVPYKTPWCMLGFVHGMTLLAGVAVGAAWRGIPSAWGKALLAGALVAAGTHLGYQAVRGSFVVVDHPTNPYVYAHTSRDVEVLAGRVLELTDAHPLAEATPVQVACREKDYWPLPWYLRGLSHVGYHNAAPPHVAAPLLIVQPELLGEVSARLGEGDGPRLYVPIAPLPSDGVGDDWNLRVDRTLFLYASAELWERWSRR